jgi:hypothetical protein
MNRNLPWRIAVIAVIGKAKAFNTEDKEEIEEAFLKIPSGAKDHHHLLDL